MTGLWAHLTEDQRARALAYDGPINMGDDRFLCKKENEMGYRNIEVDGRTYEYTVGRTHLKVRGFRAILKEEVGTPTGSDGEDDVYTVTPADVAKYIRYVNSQPSRFAS